MAMSIVSAPVRIRPHAHPLGRRTQALLVVLEGFVGIGALYGGINLLTDANGFGVEESWLDGTPFPNYTIPGVFLFVVVGGGMLAAAVTALIGSDWAELVAFCMGVTLLIFLTVETVVIGYQGFAQVRLLAIAGIPALVLVTVGSKALGESPSH
jgi:peptidoglycan/LPS O-acetylase OafA/YrhL